MSEYKLIWNDEFTTDGPIDQSKWNIEIGRGYKGWGNGESQFYTDNIKNVFIKNGFLHLRAFQEEAPDHDLDSIQGGVFGRNYTSAKISTKGKHFWKYGRFEIKAKMPLGKGTWPAIWMMPESHNKNEKWPDCGEIDIMEHLGKRPNELHHSLHSGRYNFQDHDSQYKIVIDQYDATSKFVEYAIEWTPEYVEFFLDGISIGKLSKGQENRETDYLGWPFDKEFYLIINLAIGGYWGGEIDNSKLPSEVLVEYVRVYQKV